MSFQLFFAIFFRSGARLITLLTVGALTDLQLPATASNVCTTDAIKAGGVGRVPPNPGYAGASTASRRQPLSVVGPETKQLKTVNWPSKQEEEYETITIIYRTSEKSPALLLHIGPYRSSVPQ